MSSHANSPLLRIIVGTAALRRAPAEDAPLETQMLFGEIFSIEQEQGGWAKGHAVLDQYPGYVRLGALGPLGPMPTHQVSVPRSFVYRDADLKSPPLLWLGMNAQLALRDYSDGFGLIEDLGWIYASHTTPVGVHARDYVCVAELYIGAPYLWGGRDGLGMDCSGLVQTALQRAGLACPRDTYQQVELGVARRIDQRMLQRGDLIFWNGHVGMMRDAATLLHANAFHMQVVSEPLADAVARIAQSGSQISGVRRLSERGS